MTTRNRSFAASLLLLPVLILSACSGASSAPSAPVDTTPPTVSISDGLGAATVKATGNITFTFTFSEDVGTSFSQADITVTPAGATAVFSRVSGTVSRLVVTPPTTTGTITVTVAAGAFMDVAGNASTAAATASRDYDTTVPDTTPPTVAISDGLGAATVKATGDVTFTFTFSEDVGTSFTASDVAVTGGTAGTFTAPSNVHVATLVVSPPANAAGNILVSVPAGAFADLANNASAVAYSATREFDTRPSTAAYSTITFDSASVVYTLTGFGGAEDSTVVPDPTNGANKVARVNRSTTAETWAGTTVSTAGAQSAGKLPFDASNNRMTVRVYSPAAGITVRLKVEDATNTTISCETEAVTTVAHTWETLTFDFAKQASGTAALNVANTYNKVSIFFNFGTAGATAGAQAYYFDDVAFIGGTSGGGGPTGFSTLTFEPVAGVTYTLTGFGGAEDSALVADPANAANTVVRVNRAATAATWAGTTVSTGAAQSVGVLPFAATNTIMSVKVYSPAAGIPVRLKVEDAANNTITCETEALTTVANSWETLTFDFSKPATATAALNFASTYNKVSVFFNFGKDGATAGAQTYYFDDVTFVGGTGAGGGGGGGGGGASGYTPITFEPITGVTYTLTGFGGNTSGVVVDPVVATNHVVQVLKTAAAQTWAGTTVSTLVGDQIPPLPFTATNTIMSVRTYSPAAGIPVRLKVEDAADPTHSVETEALTTVANGWETLTFDFNHPATGTAALNLAFTFNRLSIFFNFNVAGPATGQETYYFDDVTFVGAPAGGGGGGGGGTGGTAPVAAPTAPTVAPANVISLFSSTYTGGIGDYSARVGSYDASCFGGGPSTVTDFTIPGTSHTVKQYTVSVNSFLSIETIGASGGTTPSGDSAVCNGGTQTGANLIDISQMKGLHLDVWASKAAVTFNGNVYTAPTLPFNNGAGAVSAAIGNQAFAAATWVSIDIPFGDLSQITKMSLLQIFSAEGGTFYVDNIYFHK